MYVLQLPLQCALLHAVGIHLGHTTWLYHCNVDVLARLPAEQKIVLEQHASLQTVK